MAEHSSFMPVVFSVYGSVAGQANEMIHRCTEKMAGMEGTRSPGFQKLLHLQRARIQAAVSNAVCLNFWGRKEKWLEDQRRTEKLRKEEEDCAIPWECVLADALPGRVEEV